MRLALAGVLIFLTAGIVAINFYLSPDDLQHCQEGPTATDGCRRADAIVTVSGGDTIARTREAISLYHAGWAPKLVFSGAALDKSGPSNAEVMRQEARAANVPDEAILIEEYSETTKENAENTQDILKQNGIASVILVTSGYHQRRAGLEFTKRSEGIAVRNHPVATDNQWSSWWWATPVGWYLAIGELMKILVFYGGGIR